MRLYKKDANGSMRFIEILADGPTLVQRSGLIGTDSPIEHRRECKPKNMGRSNETSAREQAELEGESLVKKRLDEGYFKTQSEADMSVVVLPMLAKDYKKESRRIDWARDVVYVQPKLDGMRCLAKISISGDVTLVSRQGKTIANMAHVVTALKRFPQRDVILDGELYVHGLSFQENMKLIKKFRPGQTENVRYHIYDLVSRNCFEFRKDWLEKWFSVFSEPAAVTLVNSLRIYSPQDLAGAHEKNIGAGYEGTIIRWGSLGYEADKRSQSLLKYKDFEDIACRVLDIEPSEARPEQGVPVLEYNGKTFRAGVKMSHEDRAEILSNKGRYIGQTAEIRFFEWTDDGMPRFPVLVGFRLDK